MKKFTPKLVYFDKVSYDKECKVAESKLNLLEDARQNALKIVKRRYPELTASFFGKDAQPEALPDWITYYKNPKKDELNAIYNNSAINDLNSK